MRLNEALGKEVRAELAARQMSLVQLARLTGIQRSTLYNYIDARRPFPLEGIIALGAVLRVAPSELLRRAERRVQAESPGDVSEALQATHPATGRAAARVQPDTRTPWCVGEAEGYSWRSDGWMVEHGWEFR